MFKSENLEISSSFLCVFCHGFCSKFDNELKIVYLEKGNFVSLIEIVKN